MVEATVAAVAAEPRYGRLRVELDLDLAGTRIPVQHGLTGQAEIVVEHASPTTLLLRSAGHWLALPAGQRG